MVLYGAVKGLKKKLPEEDRRDDDTTQHKNAIRKLMFICAVGFPQNYVDDEGNEKFFDGKMGIWDFSAKIVAKRDSINRPRGTEDLKQVSVDHHWYLAKMLLIYQSIREKMPFLDASSSRMTQGLKPAMVFL